MTFRLNDCGNLSLVNSCAVGDSMVSSTYSRYDNLVSDEKSFIYRLSDKFNGNNIYSVVPLPLVLATSNTMDIASAGIFWGAFMRYIFPYLLDIAKVFCAIKIAQGFYQEKRGGSGDGTGFGALVTYGKWYLVFWLVPWFVQLIDEVGAKMISDLGNSGI